MKRSAFSDRDILEVFADASGLGREWFDATAGFGCITRRGRTRTSDDLRAEGSRRRSAANYHRVLADPSRHAAYKRRRRTWWRRRNPLPDCVECGKPVSSGHAKRCPGCLPAWRRALAAARQRRHKHRARVARPEAA